MDDCNNPRHGKGVCRKHYMRCWREELRWPNYEPKPRPSKAELFYLKVDKNGPWREELQSHCWLWTASKYPSGYGQFDHNTAHRRSYEFAHPGKNIAGMHVDHLCRRVDCVNPDHLEAVTPSENQRRGYSVNIMTAARRESSSKSTQCRRQHSLSPDNLYVNPLGHKVCRTCRRMSQNRLREERKCSQGASGKTPSSEG